MFLLLVLILFGICEMNAIAVKGDVVAQLLQVKHFIHGPVDWALEGKMVF